MSAAEDPSARATLVRNWRVFLPMWLALGAWVVLGLLSSVVELPAEIAPGILTVFLIAFFGAFVLSRMRAARHGVPQSHFLLWGMLAPFVAAIPPVLLWHFGLIVVRLIGG